jgi:hypothetical protein
MVSAVLHFRRAGRRFESPRSKLEECASEAFSTPRKRSQELSRLKNGHAPFFPPAFLVKRGIAFL